MRDSGPCVAEARSCPSMDEDLGVEASEQRETGDGTVSRDGGADAGVKPLVVSYDKREIEIEPGGQLTFGRDEACDICLRPSPSATDEGVSRIAGYLAAVGGYWRVVNNGQCDTSVLAIHYEERSPSTLFPRRFAVVDEPEMAIVVNGNVRKYLIAVKYPLDALLAPLLPPSPISPTTSRDRVQLTDKQRRAVLALFEPVLTSSLDEHQPAHYAQAAHRLGISESAVRRRIESVRTGCINVGAGGLDREGGLEAESSKPALLTYLLATNVVRRGDRLSEADLRAEAKASHEAACNLIAGLITQPSPSRQTRALRSLRISEKTLRSLVDRTRVSCLDAGIAVDGKHAMPTVLEFVMRSRSTDLDGELLGGDFDDLDSE